MSRRVKVLLVLVGAIGVVAAIAALVKSGAEASELRRTEAELAKQQAEARALGIPIEPSDLKRNPPLAESVNAAPALAELTKLTARGTALESPVKRMIHAEASMTDEAKAQGWTLVQPLLATLREACEKPHCDFDYDYSKAPSLSFPEVEASRTFARLLQARAAASAKAGRLEDALGDLRAMRELGRLVGETPDLLPALVQESIDQLSMAGLTQAMSDCADQPAALRRIRRELDSLQGPGPDLVFAARGMPVRGVATARSLASVHSKGFAGVPKLPNGSRARKQLAQAVEARVVRYWCGVWKAFRAGSDRTALAEKLAGVKRAMGAPQSISDEFADLIIVDLASVASVTRTFDAWRRVARAMAYVHVFRAEHGRLPSTLAEAGSHEVDPFDGQPLRYKPEGQGFVVYSVGKDGKDDGGMLTTGIEGPMKLDQGWAWTPAQKGGAR